MIHLIQGIQFGCLLGSSKTMRRCDLGAWNLDQRVQHLPWYFWQCSGHSSSVQVYKRTCLLATCVQTCRDSHRRSSARILYTGSTVIHVRRHGWSHLLFAKLARAREIHLQLSWLPSKLI